MSEYETDILLWSEEQAEALRRRAFNKIDWENVAEEIESVGRTELRAVVSHLVQALLHDLKAEAWPTSPDAPHWRAEARNQRDQARDAYAPSMAERPELRIDRLYLRALRLLPETVGGVAPLPVPDTCTVTLTELLAEPPDGP